MAGTAGGALPKKLGIKTGHTVVLLNAPTGFERSVHRDVHDVRLSSQLRPAADVVVFFIDSVEDLERRFADIVDRLHPEGGLWVAWRNRSVNRIGPDVVRRIGMAAGMIDNKECALDDVWSGVRLVIKSENRDAIAYRAERAEREVVRAPRRARRATMPGAGSTQSRARARSSR
jgi:hypothetical protein